MEQQTLSIIIPTYNRLIPLAECLESIYRQLDALVQVIIVNDCGPSVQSVVHLYPELNIKVIELEKNSKHVVARNRALQEVDSKYIMLCDDDDLLLPGHIERMRHAIEDADLVYSDAEIVDYEWREHYREPIHRQLFAYDQDLAGMRKFSTFIASGCLFRKSLIDAIGPFDEEMRNYWDWDFYLRAVQYHRVHKLPVASILYAFSMQGDNLSNQLDRMRPNLDRLSNKHQLGELPTANFFLLLEKPEVQQRITPSQRIWDGRPIISRLVQDLK